MKIGKNMSPSDIRNKIAMEQLQRLGVDEHRAAWLVSPGFDYERRRVLDDLGTLWATAAAAGGWRFLEVFPPAEDVLVWTSDSIPSWKAKSTTFNNERYEKLLETAKAGGLEGYLAAWRAGVSLEDILA